MDKYTLRRDDGADVRLAGERIARVSSYDTQRHGGDTRWTELDLYRTAKGKLICHEIGRTIWQGERDRYAVHVCDNEAQLISALGQGWLAKALYSSAGIDAAEEVD